MPFKEFAKSIFEQETLARTAEELKVKLERAGVLKISKLLPHDKVF